MLFSGNRFVLPAVENARTMASICLINDHLYEVVWIFESANSSMLAVALPVHPWILSAESPQYFYLVTVLKPVGVNVCKILTVWSNIKIRRLFCLFHVLTHLQSETKLYLSKLWLFEYKEQENDQSSRITSLPKIWSFTFR